MLNRIFPPGSEEHWRAYVGPQEDYDLMGASQFALLFREGLRESHRLLDIGCGSLRAGRFLIPYLGVGNYIGVEPSAWLIEQAIENEIGNDLVRIKRPTFLRNDSFQYEELLPRSFDYILLQSIFSHTSVVLLHRALSEVARLLSVDGQALFTVITSDCPGADAMPSAADIEGWRYPGCVKIDVRRLFSIAEESRLQLEFLDWEHPRQQWLKARLA